LFADKPHSACLGAWAYPDGRSSLRLLSLFLFGHNSPVENVSLSKIALSRTAKGVFGPKSAFFPCKLAKYSEDAETG
jgi:hypothetical protein